MKREATLLFAMLGALAFGSSMIGCEKKSSMEEAMDDAADAVEDAADDAADAVEDAMDH